MPDEPTKTFRRPGGDDVYCGQCPVLTWSRGKRNGWACLAYRKNEILETDLAPGGWRCKRWAECREEN